MRLIKLTQGYYTKVDDTDYEWLSKYKWHIKKCYGKCLYASNCGVKLDSNKSVGMHRLILGIVNSSLECDHIDHDTLNNQRSNLRICTHQQNLTNRKALNNTSSKYLGVYKTKYGKYVSHLTIKGKQMYLGMFKTEIRAAIEYDKVALIYHKEFANLNILKPRK